MQTELTQPGKLIKPDGHLAQVGWARHPIIDCNLEAARFYLLRPFQRFRLKRWDYYAVFTKNRFFSATIADLGYAGNIFVYTLDFETGELHEEGLVVPFGKGIMLPRNSTEGESCFKNEKASLQFSTQLGQRHISVSWPEFHEGRGISADIRFSSPEDQESMNIVIPIGRNRFYYNRKLNCMDASGTLIYGDLSEKLTPETCLGSLDWGRGVWEYKSFWNWASASGFLQDGRKVGLNMGCGFGDLTHAGENALILEDRIHKLDFIKFDYESGNIMKPWNFKEENGRLDLVFTPFRDRTAATKLGIISSEVHQMFGRYNGKVVTDEGESIIIKDLLGFAEEHQARW